MFNRTSLRFKITFPVVLYVIIIGIAGNLFLYFHLQEAVFRKTERLDRDREEAVRLQLERNFENIFSLAVVCATEPAVLQLVSRQNRTQREITLDSLNVQSQINAFLRVNPVNYYIDKLILFSNQDLFVQAQGRQSGSPTDPDNIRQLPLYTRLIADDLPWVNDFNRSINNIKNNANYRDCYSLLFRIQGSYRNDAEAYLYIEAGIDMITDIFQSYDMESEMFAKIPETNKTILHNRFRLVLPREGELGYIPTDVKFPFFFPPHRMGGGGWGGG